MSQNRSAEFVVADDYVYRRDSALRWIASHLLRYRFFLVFGTLCYITAYTCFSMSRYLFGVAADEIISPTRPDGLLLICLLILGVLVTDGLSSLMGALSMETLAQRLARDSRQELYTSLLGKSQTFHNQQRVGDIMARSTDDINQMNMMINPGVLFMWDMVIGISVPLLIMATIRLELLLVPLLFVASYILTVREYAGRLGKVVSAQREAFGAMNAGLEETISGIEVVKATARETYERDKFRKNAREYRRWFAKQGQTEATYLPTLMYAFALGFTFLHCLLLNQAGLLSFAQIVSAMSLMTVLRWPVQVSVFSWSMIQQGISGAERVLKIINSEADMDENKDGYRATVAGDIRFENVTFGYEDGDLLIGVDLHIEAGETVAIVGQTGSGKTTLTELINRTYDVKEGRVLVDGVDVREWSLDSLRSQISRIEQDVFLFSRSLHDNIAFGAPNATREDVIRASKEAQAHDFIMSFADGYETVVGERGVTLSGGQRQRIALARAFLSNPRILILDDSTSAIDSATEDEIQKAINRAQEGRTTLLITHRLSQIRWADRIIVMEGGRVVANGKHDDLLRTSAPYRRIFARYDVALPPLAREA
jgi:ATP-binding cassette subfamily B protein